MNTCPHCMQQTKDLVCSNCGKNLLHKAAAGQLPVWTLLQSPQGGVYQIGAALGQGGFGITYAAMDVQSLNRVAIKEYYPSGSAARNENNHVSYMTGREDSYMTGMNSFLNEAMTLSAAGALDSVVTVLDCFEANGTAYIVMEYVEGVSLQKHVKKNGKMSADSLMKLLPNLLQDLEQLHKTGLIHRDISPDNLILTPDGGLKLIDFGSARSFLDDKTLTMLLKTGFSPVEQYRSHGQGAWTDIYALAATIYYCLTGEAPPSAVDRIEEDDLKSPNSKGADLTPGQERALLKALAVQPKDRFSDVKALYGALLCGEMDEEPEKPAPKKQKKWIAVVSAVAALAVAAVLGFVFLTGGSGGTTEGGFVWEELDENYAIIKSYEGPGGDVEIPYKIADHVVKYIENNTFGPEDNITAVTVDGHIEPRELAFAACDRLQFVSLTGNADVSAAWSNALAMCEDLRCLMLQTQNAAFSDTFAALMEDAGVVLCYEGQDTGHGKVRTAAIKDDVVYVMTDADMAVAMYVPQGMALEQLPQAIEDHPVVVNGFVNVEGFGYIEIAGTTEDGYAYGFVKDGTEGIILGYSGSDLDLITPELVEGVPVTVIAPEAFKDEDCVAVFLTQNVTVMSRAFAGCEKLLELIVPTGCVFEQGAFEGCTNLQAAMYEGDDPFEELSMPDAFTAYFYGEETPAGKLVMIWRDEYGALYGETEEGALLLRIPSGIKEYAVMEDVQGKPVTWIDVAALDYADKEVTILLASRSLIAPDLVNKAQWAFPLYESQITPAECWYYSCLLANKAVLGTPNEKLMQIAMDAAEEMHINAAKVSAINQSVEQMSNGYTMWTIGHGIEEVIYDVIDAHLDACANPESLGAPEDSRFEVQAVGIYMDPQTRRRCFVCLALS